MPKFTKKNRSARNAPTRPTTRASALAAEEAAANEDAMSVCSNVSDQTSIYDEVEAANATAANEIIFSTDNLEEKFDTAIEGLRNKDLKTREGALRTLQVLFSQKYLPDAVANRSESLTELLIGCVKKGNESEGKLATIVAVLFLTQIGEPDDEVYGKFRDAFLPIVRDDSQPAVLRTSCAQALGFICFVAGEEISATVDLMKALESVFAQSYPSTDGNTTAVTHEQQELHTAALFSWTLLFSTMPNNYAHDLIRLYAPEKIPSLIESNDADLRNQAGETIAVLYEVAREVNSVFAEPPESLLVLLDKKANESVKYKGKKEKRLQRSTFREIYSSFEDGTAPELTIKFGREVLEITSWTGRFYYYGFSSLLGTGMNVHLKENGLLRSIFNLEDVEVEEGQKAKGNRFERQMANKAAFKSRTQALKKTRANKVTRIQHED